MLRIPKSVDYGVLILLTLYENRGQLLNAKEIAQHCGVSHQQVAKLLKLLLKNELVSSRQGARGGYMLPDQAGRISLEQIYLALEGPFSFAECMDRPSAELGCKVDAICRLKPHLVVLDQAIRSVCRSLTIQDISARRLQTMPFLLPQVLEEAAP